MVQDGGGGFLCQIEFAVVNFAEGNFAKAPGFLCGKFCGRSQKCCGVWGFAGSVKLSHGCHFAEYPGVCGGNFAANLKHEIFHTKLTAPEIPARNYGVESLLCVQGGT